MTNEEIIAELRRDNAELRSSITHLETKIEIADINIKGLTEELNHRITFERNMIMLGFAFTILIIVITALRIILNLMEYAENVEDYKTHTEYLITRKFNEYSRSCHETAGVSSTDSSLTS